MKGKNFRFLNVTGTIRVICSIFIICVLIGFSGCTQNQTPVDPLKNQLRFLLPESPTELDPTTANETFSAPIVYHAFEPLVREDESGEIIPALAESWTIEDSNQRFIFKIRENAKWSDEKPVTAQDMVATLQYMLDPASESKNAGLITPYIVNGAAYNSGSVGADALGVKALDDHTLVIETPAPTPYFLQILSFAVLSPVRVDIIKAKGAAWDESAATYISNGPYKMVAYEKNGSIILEKNPHYWNKNAITLEKITFFFKNKEQNAIALYKNGDVDGIYEVESAELRTNPELEADIHTHVAPSTAFMIFNHANPLMASSHFRAAIELSIDRMAIVDENLLGAGIPTRYLVPFMYQLGGENFHDFTNLSKPQDLGGAKAKLDALRAEGLVGSDGAAASGAATATALAALDKPIRIFAMDTGNDGAIAQSIAKTLNEDLGLQVEVTSMPWGDLFNKALASEYDIVMLGFGGDYPHPMTFLSNFTQEGILTKILSWSDPNYDKLLNDTLMIVDEKSALENFRKLEGLVIDDNHIINLYYRKKVTLMSSRIEGWYRNSTSQFVFTGAKTK